MPKRKQPPSRRVCYHCGNKLLLSRRNITRTLCVECGQLCYWYKKIGQWETEADRIFSRLIRYGLGGPCLTCGEPVNPDECDCGHFVSRSRHRLRYHTLNCHPQHKQENRGLARGYQKADDTVHARFAAGIDAEYGDGTAEFLEQLGLAEYPRRRIPQYRELVTELRTICKSLGVYV